MKKFCVLTSGRAGSTALMDALARYSDIAVPNKQVNCPDNELLHPRYQDKYKEYYSQLVNHPFIDEMDFINAFFSSNSDFPYVGFKSMPHRHFMLKELAGSDVQLITITRRDVASTVASFMVARRANTWRRSGGRQQHKLIFDDTIKKECLDKLQYIKSCKHTLSLYSAIDLYYEDVCKPDFVNEKLDFFFNRHISIEAQEPTNAEHYVDNWVEFKTFISDNL